MEEEEEAGFGRRECSIKDPRRQANLRKNSRGEGPAVIFFDPESWELKHQRESGFGKASIGLGSSQHKTVFFGGWGPKDPLPPPYLQVSFTIALIREGFSGMVEWGALSTEGLL